MNKDDIRNFFVERIAEMTHKDTLDSYRVRSHNVYTLLEECMDVISSWSNSNIKLFETVTSCVEETIDAIEKDECIDFIGPKEVLLDELRNYKAKGKPETGLSDKLCFLISKILKNNKDKYLNNLYAKIFDILINSGDEIDDNNFLPILDRLDKYTTPFISQLIYKGFSKTYLYQRITKVLKAEKHSYESRLDYLRRLLCRKDPYEADVIFKIDVTNKVRWVQQLLNLKNNIPENLLSDTISGNNSNFVKQTQSSRFYIFHCKQAWDAISAIKTAREHLSSDLDSIHLGLNSLDIEIPNKALVVFTKRDGSLSSEMATEYVLDGDREQDNVIVTKILNKIDKIRNDANIDEDVKERLNSALRHLRIGNLQNELEQRFINYWIALEFIFSSPKVESTFTRLKYNLVNLLTACYMKRNILMLNRMLIKSKIIRRDESIWNMTKADYESLVSRQSSILMKYRLLRMKAKLFESSDKRKSYINSHEKNLNYHIVRIYRLRNELIHEAALKHDIENITSNLRYYLVFLLTQMINYYVDSNRTEELANMDHFFYTYDIWKQTINRGHNLKDIMDVPLDMTLTF